MITTGLQHSLKAKRCLLCGEGRGKTHFHKPPVVVSEFCAHCTGLIGYFPLFLNWHRSWWWYV